MKLIDGLDNTIVQQQLLKSSKMSKHRLSREMPEEPSH